MTYYIPAHHTEPAHIDFRSDTVTKPTAAMREAMAQALVGDDVYGDDPTVNALQEHVADLLGKEAALFMASGTQSNLCAMLAHCARGEEILVGDKYHVFLNEAAGASVLGGVAMAPLPTDARGVLPPQAIDTAVKPDDFHCPVSRVLSLENTVSGHVQTVAQLNACAARARAHGLAVHIDGARLMNAVVALGVDAAEVVGQMDSVSLCLSKGLGAPAGSVLAGSAAFIARARRLRKILGGGMRQAGILAAAGLYALQHHVAPLARDHANARQLAAGLAEVPSLRVEAGEVESNMVFVRLPCEQDAEIADKLRAHMAARGILLGGGTEMIRLATHLDISEAAVEEFIGEMRGFFA